MGLRTEIWPYFAHKVIYIIVIYALYKTTDFYLNNFFLILLFFQYLFFLRIIDQHKTNRNYETVTVPLFPKLISKTDGNEQRKKNRKT